MEKTDDDSLLYDSEWTDSKTKYEHAGGHELDVFHKIADKQEQQPWPAVSSS